MKKNLRNLLAALLALILILSAAAALAAVKCPYCGSTSYREFEPGIYGCNNCWNCFYGTANYMSFPLNGEGMGQLTFVSTRKCLVVKDNYQEYFSFRVEDGKLIFINGDGVETEVAVGEDGRGALELALANGDTFTADIARTTLNYIVHNGVFPTETKNEPEPK